MLATPDVRSDSDSTNTSTSTLLDPADVQAAAQLLAQSLSTIIEPDAFTQLIGTRALVDALLDAWVSVMQTTKGVRLKKLAPFFNAAARSSGRNLFWATA